MEWRGLDKDAFAAYAPEKWSSNVHNLPRMRVKEALLALGDVVQKGVEGELAGLSRAASDDVPNIGNQKKVDAQWVYWFRDQKEREGLASFFKATPLDETALLNIAPHDKHATLAVVLRQEALWVGLRVAAGAVVDRKNLASKLGKSWERDSLIELLRELPDGAVFGPERTPTTSLDLPAIEAAGGRLGKQDPAWEIGHLIPAAEAIQLGRDLADEVVRWLGVLSPLYRFAAWSRDNDHTEVVKQLQQEKEQQRRQATSHRSGDKVRIISGLFTGKTGVVESIDAKAQVKVRVGKMSVVVSGNDLLPA
jgi:hypothetical protein